MQVKVEGVRRRTSGFRSAAYNGSTPGKWLEVGLQSTGVRAGYTPSFAGLPGGSLRGSGRSVTVTGRGLILPGTGSSV